MNAPRRHKRPEPLFGTGSTAGVAATSPQTPKKYSGQPTKPTHSQFGSPVGLKGMGLKHWKVPFKTWGH